MPCILALHGKFIWFYDLICYCIQTKDNPTTVMKTGQAFGQLRVASFLHLSGYSKVPQIVVQWIKEKSVGCL